MKIYRILRGVRCLLSTFYNKILFHFNGVKFGCSFRSCGTILVRNYAGNGKIIIGEQVYVNSHRTADPIGGDAKTILCTTEQGNIVIGDRVGLSNCAIYSSNSITIENDAVIGAGCKIYDTDFHSADAEKRLKGNKEVPSAPVVISEKAFIGGHTIILKGVHIGECSVVGAGSVVTHDIPNNEVWAGNPAHFIKHL
ncbi:MAG: acyltransferase [Clostridiales bacterium]|nr:acyltransferase [Clostridiales bacterium]